MQWHKGPMFTVVEDNDSSISYPIALAFDKEKQERIIALNNELLEAAKVVVDGYISGVDLESDSFGRTIDKLRMVVYHHIPKGEE